ncbi:Crp/Fnr family transcriptional regulator [Roseococcus sp. DSY-14]|uniref:Crp/Fnr family transcriptional regulator n=1 Tax=Roseococcus sp. DSY-14 TaxID=3369650 RepID=UPI00387A95C5
MSALLRFPPFAALGPAALAALGEGAQEMAFPAGAALMRRDAAEDRALLLLEGALRVGATSPEGRSVTFRVVQPVELVGEISVLDGGPRTADVEALGPCRVLCLPGPAVRRAVAAHPEVGAAFVRLLCRRLRDTSTGMEGIATLRLPERMAATLLRVAREQGTGMAGGAVLLPARLSQGELAAMVAATREAVNRQLAAWREDGLVEARGGRLALLRPAALEALLG